MQKVSFNFLPFLEPPLPWANLRHAFCQSVVQSDLQVLRYLCQVNLVDFSTRLFSRTVFTVCPLSSVVCSAAWG